MKWSGHPGWSCWSCPPSCRFLQRGLLTQSLTGLQWLACIGLALVLPIVVEVDKWIRRRSLPRTQSAVAEVVAPTRAAAPAA